MEAIYIQGILMAEALQRTTQSHEKLWLTASHLGDPKAALLLVFPLVYFLSRRAGVAVLWVAALSEWLNLVLKWMLFGERPFWWIGESGLYDDKNRPQIQQFASTCETGPGSPSGHAMVTAAVWWVIASSLGSLLYARTRSVLIAATPFLLYLLMLVCVGLSRVFILAHFPHQVVTGSLTGLVLGVILNRSVPAERGLRFFACVSAGLLLGAALIHTALELAGVDVSWSILLAQKWCSRPEWIRLDTAPFSSLMRACGALLGLGLAQRWKPGGWALSWGSRALCLALSSMALYHVQRLPLPVRPPALFYALFFLKFVVVPQVVMVIVPGLVHLLTSKKKKD